MIVFQLNPSFWALFVRLINCICLRSWKVIVSKIWMQYSPKDHQIYKQVVTAEILIFHLGKIESTEIIYILINFPRLKSFHCVWLHFMWLVGFLMVVRTFFKNILFLRRPSVRPWHLSKTVTVHFIRHRKLLWNTGTQIGTRDVKSSQGNP